MKQSFFRAKVIGKTRKDHICDGCGKIIEAGSNNVKQNVGVYDGEFLSSYICRTCDEYMRNPKYHDAFAEGFERFAIPSIVREWESEIK